MDYNLQQHGFSLIPGVLSTTEIAELRLETAQIDSPLRGGARNLLAQSALINSFVRKTSLKQIADTALKGNAFPVRALFFDKVPDANWKVPWHQDITIAVRERINTPGFSGWSEKDGVPHVHPPEHVLNEMVSLRIHLDDCGLDSGPLRVLPGTHTQGVLNSEEIELHKSQHTEVICTAQAGDVLAMRPLLLHASSPAKSPSHRRVIHIEYACSPLPAGLHWHEQTEALAL